MVRYVKLSSTGTKRMELGEGRSGSSTYGSKGLNKHMNEFVVCVRNEGYEASLELRKIYQVLADTGAARHHLLRVIDESGEDYLYPQDFFLPIELPKALEKAVLAVA
jgi:hypothetical protein